MENKNTMYWVAGMAAVLAGAGFIYYKFGMVDKGASATSGVAPGTGGVPPATGKDYTGLANAKSLFPNMPETAHGLNLGDEVTVRAGAVVTRLDQSLANKGTTKLTADKVLGKIWKHDVGATIRANAGFDYPFYRVEYADINQKGGVVDKAVGKVKSFFGYRGADGLNADGFGEL